jgi:hypothetical protein
VVVRRVVVEEPTYGLVVVVVVADPVVTGGLVSASMWAVQLESMPRAAIPERASRIWNLVFMGQVGWFSRPFFGTMATASIAAMVPIPKINLTC